MLNPQGNLHCTHGSGERTSSREISVDYIEKKQMRMESFHKTATDPPWKELGLYTVHRFLLLIPQPMRM